MQKVGLVGKQRFLIFLPIILLITTFYIFSIGVTIGLKPGYLLGFIF